jgi:hypothetical protein
MGKFRATSEFKKPIENTGGCGCSRAHAGADEMAIAELLTPPYPNCGHPSYAFGLVRTEALQGISKSKSMSAPLYANDPDCAANAG